MKTTLTLRTAVDWLNSHVFFLYGDQGPQLLVKAESGTTGTCLDHSEGKVSGYTRKITLS